MLLFVACRKGDSQRYALTGTLFQYSCSPYNLPLKGVPVQLYAGTRMLTSGFTDSNGRYFLSADVPEDFTPHLAYQNFNLGLPADFPEKPDSTFEMGDCYVQWRRVGNVFFDVGDSVILKADSFY